MWRKNTRQYRHFQSQAWVRGLQDVSKDRERFLRTYLDVLLWLQAIHLILILLHRAAVLATICKKSKKEWCRVLQKNKKESAIRSVVPRELPKSLQQEFQGRHLKSEMKKPLSAFFDHNNQQGVTLQKEGKKASPKPSQPRTTINCQNWEHHAVFHVITLQKRHPPMIRIFRDQRSVKKPATRAKAA